MKKVVKITRIEDETKDVKKLIIEKPKDFSFIPGHSIMVSINKPGLENKKIPLTFTSTNYDNYIEFILKRYSNTLSEVIFSLRAGDELILNEMFSTVRYNGPGIFIAGGIGIVPFISIFRHLKLNNRIENNILIYSVKKSEDILGEKELKESLGDNCIITLTKKDNKRYNSGRITDSLLKEKISDFNTNFYISGSDNFIIDIRKMIKSIKESQLQKERYINPNNL